MKQSIVRVEYGEKKSKSEKFFVAKAIIDGKTKDTKTLSIGSKRSEQEAFDLALKSAKTLGTKYNVVPETLTMDEVKARYKPLKGEKASAKEQPATQSMTGAADSLIDKFGHALRFKSLIKHVIKTHGLDKTIDMLETGLQLAKEIFDEQRKSAKALHEANIKIAQVILDTRKSGIDMPAPNDDIERAIEEIMSRSQSPARFNSMLGDYEYKGEQWDGKGTMPASFSAYLNENENHRIEDLLRSNQAKLLKAS